MKIKDFLKVIGNGSNISNYEVILSAYNYLNGIYEIDNSYSFSNSDRCVDIFGDFTIENVELIGIYNYIECKFYINRVEFENKTVYNTKNNFLKSIEN